MEALDIVFFCIAGVQLLFLIVFLVALKKKKVPTEVPVLPPVSVVICAHDEEENLRQLIPALLNQNYPEFEIVVIDDRSNDGTFDYLNEGAHKDQRIKMVHVNQTPPHVNSKKYCMTLGIKAAKHDWLLLTDADCRPSSDNWIQTMAASMQEKTDFVIGFSPYTKTKGFLNLFIRFECLLTALQYMVFAFLKSPYMGVGRNLAYKKSFFLKEKGFNQFMKVTGGDDDLFVNQHANGSNTAVVTHTDAVMYSIPETSWGAFFKQKKRHLSVGKHYKFKHRFWLGVFAITWILSWAIGITAAILSEQYYFVLGALVFRTLFLLLTLRVGSQRIGQKFEWWAVPFLDFLFAIYYLTTGLLTMGSKKVRWKN